MRFVGCIGFFLRFDHCLAGPGRLKQIPYLAKRGFARISHIMEDLDGRLSESKYFAGDNYSVADITAFASVGFAGWVKVLPKESLTNRKRWHNEMNARRT